jgi:predicted alpha/beta superfamily hydrolase
MSDTPSPATKPPPQPAAYAVFAAGIGTHRLSRRTTRTADGRAWQIFSAIPAAGPPAGGYPLLVMLDGNAAFDVLTPELLAAAPGLAIVGLGHDTPLRFDVLARSRDYTPPRGPDDPSPDPQRPERLIGGAGLFLDTLIAELLPVACAGFPFDPGRTTLWGHSLAGLFVVYTLLTRPRAFTRYAAASPSIWWGDEWMLGLETRSRPAEAVRAEALVMLGDSERRSSPTGPHWEGPAPHTLEMVERLRRRGLPAACEILAGLGHAATLPASLPAALAFASR